MTGVIGAFIGFFIALAFFGFLWLLEVIKFRSEVESTHWHDWRVRGTMQLYNVPSYNGIKIGKAEDGEPITLVLWRCIGCDDCTTEELSGHWTFAQVSGRFEKENETPAATEPEEVICTDSKCAVPEVYGEHVHVEEAKPLETPVIHTAADEGFYPSSEHNPDPTNILPRDDSGDPTRIMG